MAVFTPLSLDEARVIAARLGLAQVLAVEPVAAGSVNSNFFLRTSGTPERVFLRIYEEQGVDGVAFEWAWLEGLASNGFPVVPPIRGVPPVEPGELRACGKPVGAFGIASGHESCQLGVSVERAAALGRMLARLHVHALAAPETRRKGRFGPAEIAQRLEAAEAHRRPELGPTLARLRELLAQRVARRDPSLPVAVVHGDLFRDNVRWESDRIVAVLDWESAADERLVYDLMVTVLAWCFGDGLDLDLARALCRGYHEIRPLSPAEQRALRTEAAIAALRFSATRITDYHLRSGSGPRVIKDYRRFVARLEAVMAYDDDPFRDALLLR